MQHNDRYHMIGVVFEHILEDFSKKDTAKVLNNPYEVDGSKVLWLMAIYQVQRRTAKEWLMRAQVMFRTESDIREELQ